MSIEYLGSTVYLGAREDRRLLTALSKCATNPDEDRPSLSVVAFDGSLAYATDTRVVGAIEFEVDLPDEIVTAAEEEDRTPRVLVPARRLRDALAVARGKEPVRLRFEPGALHVVIGDDPLPLGDEYLPTEVVLPYEDDSMYPSAHRIRAMLDGDPDLEPDDRVVTAIGINAELLARVAALVRRGDDHVGDYVTMHPRGKDRPIEVRNANTRERLGVIAPIRTFDEFEVTITTTTDTGETPDA